MKTKISTILVLLLLIGGFLRLYNINWDDGLYLHPDERLFVNASGLSIPQSLSSFLSPSSPLNPHMFYYGSFSLYFYKFFSLFITTTSFLLISRYISALFSLVTIFFVYLLAKLFFHKKIALFSAFVFTFSVGSIQHAHFNTTESLLTLLVTLVTYLSIVAFKKKSLLFFLLTGICCGIAYATKITGITFIATPLLVLMLLIIEKTSWGKIFLFSLLLIFGTALAGVLLAPYQIIDYTSFTQQQTYMQGVTYGQYKPPFAIIYEHTIPYIYPFVHILPFTFGFLSFPLSLIGCFFLCKRISFYHKHTYIYFLLLAFPILYFAWAGSWYTKFSRYYMLLLPFLAIYAGIALAKIPKKLAILLMFGITLNGALYLTIYISPHTRIAASSWIYKNIPQGSIISGEHWDDNLPLPLKSVTQLPNYQMLQLPVYNTESFQKTEELAGKAAESDYIILSSRRVYASILNNKESYPITSKFYAKLFHGQLGFYLIKQFTSYPFFFSDDFADETFQSYDHPPVLIFKNVKRLSMEDIINQIQ